MVTTVPAIAGWFTLDAQPRLLGQSCTTCRTVVFPPTASRCPDPGCPGEELTERPLSRRGRIWSYATNHYAPPVPYVAADPFEPYTVVAAELEDERLTVLGQLATGADPADLRVGGTVELDVGPLFTDDEGTTHLVWQWRPVATEPTA